MSIYVVRDGALAGEALARVRDEVRGSPYVFGERGAAGLTATFTTPGLPELRARFGFLGSVLDVVQPPRTYRGLFGWGERLTELLATNRPNAFHLKLLVLGPGEALAPRRATTLQRRVNAPHPYPRVVSLLFLDGAEGSAGGALALHRGDEQIVTVPPAPGRLVQVRGEVEHEITAVEAPPGEGGAPLVVALLEQYSFAGPVAARLAPLAISSAARFESALAEAREKGEPEFLVDGVDGEARPAAELLRRSREG